MLRDKKNTDPENIKNIARVIRRAIVSRRKEGIRIVAAPSRLHLEFDLKNKVILKATAGECNPLEAVILNKKVTPVLMFGYLDVRRTSMLALKKDGEWIDVFMIGFSLKPMHGFNIEKYKPVYLLGKRIRQELNSNKRKKQDQEMILNFSKKAVPTFCFK